MPICLETYGEGSFRLRTEDWGLQGVRSSQELTTMLYCRPDGQLQWYQHSKQIGRSASRSDDHS